MILGSTLKTSDVGPAVNLDFRKIRDAVETRLALLAAEDTSVPVNLQNAVHYALLGQSKRVRPVMLFMIAEPCESLREAALDLGCAVEMVHTASLVLDDLPCMDDAKMRRDRPTTHLAFGQSTAILSAIALLTQAFGIIARLDAVRSETRNRIAAVLSQAVGWSGLAAGQEIDVNSKSSLKHAYDVERLNWLKTGILFVAAAEMGAHLRGLAEERVEDVRTFARHFGSAFQTADDLIDHGGPSTGALKDLGKDGDKATLVSLFGASEARLTCEGHLARAEEALVRSGVSAAPIRAMMTALFQVPTASQT